MASLTTSVMAIAPIKKSVTETNSEMKTVLLKQMNHNELTWDEQKNTVVVAEIFVNDFGKASVKAINGDPTYLTYVSEKVQSMQVDPKLAGKTFICRFKFRTN
jgi:hypothetical protein